jgi:large repetitive protein
MKALLRPLSVCGLSIAIAAMSLAGTSSVALAATAPRITVWSLAGSVYEGDRPFINATFTDPDLGDLHTVDIDWADGTADRYVLPVGDRSFSLQKLTPYQQDTAGATLRIQITLTDPFFSTGRFLSVVVQNATPSITSFGLSSTSMEAGQAVTATGAFTDGGAADTHTVTVDWGDTSPAATLNLAAGVYSFTTDPHTYMAAGDRTVTATVTDNSGAFATATSSVSVHGANQTPSITSLVVTPGNEGGSSTLALTFADADPADTHTVTVGWGDGATSDSGTLASNVTTFDVSHVYADTGAYSVVVTLADSASHTLTANASVSPTNVGPVVGSLSLSPSSVVDHQTLTVSATFTDPGTVDTFTVTVEWGDGTSWSDSLAAGTRSFSTTHAYNASGPVTIKATVADRDGGKSSSSANLDVLPSNHAPADLAVEGTAILEGDATTLSVSFTDVETSDSHTVAITWGDGATQNVPLAAGAMSTSPTHTYLETGVYTVAVTVTDGGGLSVAGGTTVTATNVSPSLSLLTLTPSTVTEHQTVTVSGTFSDPGTADTYTVRYTWGDGSTSVQALPAGTRSFSAMHDYAYADTYTVTVTVTDLDQGVGAQNASLVVKARNTAPSALSLSSNVTGLSATVSGSFTDPDALDTHDVAMTWGDGTTSRWTLAAGMTSLTATHTYATADTFTVTTTVTDPAAAFTDATKQVVTTVLSGNSDDVLDQMVALVSSLDLDRNTERWLLRKIDDLRLTLARGGNAQLCADLKVLGHISAFAGRVLTNDQAAALDLLGRRLETTAGCVGTVIPAPKVQRTTVTTTVTPTPTQKKETATVEKTTKDTPKTEKNDKSEKSGIQSGSTREGRDSR